MRNKRVLSGVTWLIAILILCLKGRRFEGKQVWKGIPEILETETKTSPTDIWIQWKVPKNSGFLYKTKLHWCKFDYSVVNTKWKLYPAIGDLGDIDNDLQKNSTWTNCQTIDLTREIDYRFTGLTPKTVYRFKVKMTSVRGNTVWSEWKVISTKIETSRNLHERVTMFA